MARVVGLFQDEIGEEDMSAGYYMASMVIHDMDEHIDSHISDYEARQCHEQTATGKKLFGSNAMFKPAL